MDGIDGVDDGGHETLVLDPASDLRFSDLHDTDHQNYGTPNFNQPPIWEFPKIRGTLLWGPYNKDPTI